MRNRLTGAWGVLALASVVALPAGCARRDQDDRSMESTAPASGESKLSADTPAASMPATAESAAKASAPPGPQPSATPDAPRLTLADYEQSGRDRYLIKNAVLTLESADVRGAESKLLEAARAVEGYVSDSHEAVDGMGSRSVTMTVRVPARDFDAADGRITVLGKLLDKQVTAEDVTEEFVDTTARTRNLKRSEERLLEHMSHTGTLRDTLTIEAELTRVRDVIERSEGRLRFLAHRVEYSTFNVTFREAAHAQSVTPAETFSSGKVATDAGRMLIGFLQSAWTVVIWLGIWAIVWLPPAALIVWSLRRDARRHRRPVVPSTPPPFDVSG